MTAAAWWCARVGLTAMGLLVAVVASAFAQGFYYKEIKRDDRIYVFNIAAEAERFEQTGEMGRGITRPGTGPNGETVVGDSERALQLFYFKHGISEVVLEPPAPMQRVEWRDGKTRDYHRSRVPRDLEPHPGALHARFSADDVSPALPGTAEQGDSQGSFRIRRVEVQARRLVLAAARRRARRRRFMPRLSYELQLNWPDVTTANAPGNMLEDANIAWDPQGRGKFRVVVGQFKVPFGRQEMTSSGNQQFVDRALVS